MIIIGIPNNNIEERKYILNIVFEEFLGLDFKLIGTTNNWEVFLENEKKVILEDHFFNKFPEDLEYLQKKNIPKGIAYYETPFNETPIPIIYGRTYIEISESRVDCGIDIFSSIFFMLNRWEESVNKKRDEHNRFPASESVAYKYNFLDRPVVNEYIEMLKNMFLYLDKNIEFKEIDSKICVSCDVDEPFDCTVESVKNLTRACAGDILKRRNITEAFKRLNRCFFNKIGIYKFDRHYTFDWYMDVCESAGLKVLFFFIPDSSEEGNGCYCLNDRKIKKLLQNINKRGHEIGVHGSYQTYQDAQKAITQKEKLHDVLLELNIKQVLKANRQHYLRWNSSITPSILDNAGFEYDTTGSYADVAGFRYGTSYEFSMFDFLKRSKLKIKQRPLIVMEGTITDADYMNHGNGKEAFEVIQDLKKNSMKSGGNFTLLWHNSSLKTQEDKELFKKVICCEE